MKSATTLGRWTVRKLSGWTLAAGLASAGLVTVAHGWADTPPPPLATTGAKTQAPLPKKIYTRSAEFKLPVQMEDRTRATLDRVCLYVKSGNSDWVQQETGPATLLHFLYRVPQDGEYWFSLTTIDKKGKMSPADVSQEPPALRVMVDTKPPSIDVQPWASPEKDLCLRCTIIDANPDPASLRVVAKLPTGDLPLLSYPNQPGCFRVLVPDMLTASLVVTGSDLSGNQTTREVLMRDLMAAAVQTAEAPTGNLPSNAPSANAPAPQVLAMGSKANPATNTSNPMPSQTAAPLPVAGSNPALPAPQTSLPPAQLPSSVSAKADLNSKSDLPLVPMLPTNEPTLPPVSAVASAPMASNPIVPAVQNFRPEIEPQPRSGLGQTPSALPASAPAAMNKQVINTTRAVLDYRIDQVGPSGVGKVDVYITNDQGQTWTRVGEDPDRRSPVEFDLPGEGLFGIRLAITNGNGFGGTTPQRGDSPLCWVEVDTSAPFVQLRPIDPVVSNGGLDIRWQATDKNLGSEPVNLYYRTRADASWQVIARGLKNDGIYHWAFPKDAAAQFFVKVEVTDLAGNTARVETPNPVVLDVTEPHVSVIGVTGLSVRSGGN